MLAARNLSRVSTDRCHSLLRVPRRFAVVRASVVEVKDASTVQVQVPPLAVAGDASQASSAGHTTVVADAAASLPQGGPLKVADLDAQRFRLHPSVEYWQNFTSYINTMFVDTDMSNLTSSLQQLVREAASSAVLRDPRAAAYWAYHSARLSFFIGQAAAGLAAHHLSETLPNGLTGWLSGSASGSSRGTGVSTSSSSGGAAVSTPFQRIMSAPGRELVNRANESLAAFQQDYDNIKAGCYPMPWDMTPAHRQNNPLFMLRTTVQSMEESVATLRRRVRNQPDPVWLSSAMYPRYYQSTFHYQTDGWLSDRSARVYEHLTELLFFGRQDAMQRTSLLPIAEYVREAALAGRTPAEMRLLEVAAGTGRFHTFIKDTYPDMPSVVSDLSPFYLARARDNLSYWRSLRQPGRHLGGVDDNGVGFLQTAAEDIDSPDSDFDILVCVYLFHELPEPIRRRAASEFFRVLKPGGLLVLTDSVQLGDRPAWDNTIGVFGDFNEPYYKSYVGCDLGALFSEAGFQCDTKYLCSATKTLSFRKPLLD